ncbi:MAG: hypothetical protein ACFLMY_09245 [Candidatus Brachytrichaceae bacterium NZ_4S206]|jgi:hypothetical protein
MIKLLSTCAVLIASGTVMVNCALPPLPARTPSPMASPVALAATAPATRAADETEALLRELAIRLIAPSFFFAGEMPPPPELFVGRVPSLFPADLPIPEGARVIGGIGRGDWSADLVVDVIQSPDDAITFVESKLTAAGWQTPTLAFEPGGFVAAPYKTKTFCLSEDGPAIFVSAQKLTTGVTDLRYSMQTFKGQPSTAYTPCKSQPPVPEIMGPPELPALVMPEGAKQFPMGGGGTGTTYSQAASIETELGVQALREHYDAQLRAAGWQAQESGGDDRVAWSTWAFKNRRGQPQQGMLFVLQQDASKPDKFVYLQVTHVASSSASGAAAPREILRQLP